MCCHEEIKIYISITICCDVTVIHMISRRVCKAIDLDKYHKDTVVCTEAKVSISWNIMRFS
jgi:hypothetical protein